MHQLKDWRRTRHKADFGVGYERTERDTGPSFWRERAEEYFRVAKESKNPDALGHSAREIRTMHQRTMCFRTIMFDLDLEFRWAGIGTPDTWSQRSAPVLQPPALGPFL